MTGHDCIHEQDFRELYGKVNETHTTVKLIDQSIRGNGQPGINQRLSTMEGDIGALKTVYNKAQGAYWLICLLGGGGFLAGIVACAKVFFGG